MQMPTLLPICQCRDSADVVSPWSVTIINSAYRNLVDSFNVDVTVAVQRIIQGTVAAGTVPRNGQSSVPITLIVEATAGWTLFEHELGST